VDSLFAVCGGVGRKEGAIFPINTNK